MSDALQCDVQNNSDGPVAIAVGANLAGPFGSPLQSCRRAVTAIAAGAGLRLVGRSAWYDTEPVPKSMQPNFINGVALFAPDGPMPDPQRLLRHLQEIETQAGRQRAAPNGPRTLDLDIVIMGDLVRDAPDPVLPHPRAHLRRFVLEPLRDVWPRWRHPVSGQSIEAMLRALPAENVRRLAPDAAD